MGDKENRPTVLSISWGGPESSYTLAALQEIDRACKAASGYQIFLDGQITVVGGTSASTPLWAGLVALINQGVGKNVEHLNQLLYKIPDSTGAFRRITKGDNTFGGVQGYSAGPSWSAVTGWGSPDGEKLIEAIKTQLERG